MCVLCPHCAGVVLWEIATGDVPVRGRMRPLQAGRDCPADVVALVESCMDPDPAQRPSAQQVVELLLALPSTPPRAQASPRRQSRDQHGRQSQDQQRHEELQPPALPPLQGIPVAPPAAAPRPPVPRSSAATPADLSPVVAAAQPRTHQPHTRSQPLQRQAGSLPLPLPSQSDGQPESAAQAEGASVADAATTARVGGIPRSASSPPACAPALDPVDVYGLGIF